MRPSFFLGPLAIVACTRASTPATPSGAALDESDASLLVAPDAATVQTGDGTFYDADGTGTCSFPASPNAMDVAALNLPQWANSALCGACARVTGPKGTVRLRIVDQCPECKPGDLDLSEQAFAKIATPVDGRVRITWNVEACDVSGPIRYHIKEGSNPYWVALQVRNHRHAIAKLEWKSNGAWTALERQTYNYFTAARGTGPLEVRATATTGEMLEDVMPTVLEDTVVDGHAQFR